MILCDTNIFIEFYKKNKMLLAKRNIAISVITEAEFFLVR